MKSRMFVVNDFTYAEAIRTNIASVFVPDLNGQQWVKTVSDIMADFLQIEIGDYIFFWETRSNDNKNRIRGVYRVISKPYYDNSDPNDKAPFKIHIEEAYHFETPLDEYEVLNCPYIRKSLWTIIGKKVANKSRGTSPLSIDEANDLITLLIGINSNYTFREFDKSRIVPVANPLSIEYKRIGLNPKGTTIAQLDPNKVNYINPKDNNVFYEKTLETMFNQEMTNKNKALFLKLGINRDKVIWYSNYLPYSIEQSEMDYVIIESDDGVVPSKIYVIEFMKTELDDDHLLRSMLYSKWVNETLAYGASVVQPIIICFKSVDFNSTSVASNRTKKKIEKFNSLCKVQEATMKVKPVQIFTYNFLSGQIDLVRKR